MSGERGSTSIQHIFLLPALFTLMFTFVQGAMYYQGKTIAIAAAEEGARVAAGEDGTIGDGEAAAVVYVGNTTLGLSDTSAVGSTTGDTVTMTVTTHTVSVIPGLDPRVVQTASLPLEQLTAG
ncbi:TadE/TadG family type IV pilus assembly protein [Myceligenerans crystallogenes]|uniref:TadE-like domain-containing protein n=1 Tax=Myceligenerans crystallogenes TaxID=316335 RepID=A0ABN2N4A8_9MICO